jgi:hypothetical protein
MAYAAAIESDQVLKEKLARHLARTITAEDVSFRPLEFAIMGKAIDFGRINGNFDSLTTYPRPALDQRNAKESAIQRG